MAKEPTERRKLNLGAGRDYIADAINHDLTKHEDWIDVTWDLNDLPWPWPACRFDHIIAKAVLEHLDMCLLEAMNECWRVIAPGGVLEVKLPYWKGEASYNDPTHRYVCGLGIFKMFDPATREGKYYDFYTPRKWTIRRVLLNQGKTSIYGVLDVRKEAEDCGHGWHVPV